MKTLVLLLVLNFSAFAQYKVEISGNIKDGKGRPVAHAYLTRFGEIAGTTSDEKGKYYLNTDNETRAYQIIAEGYHTQVFHLTQKMINKSASNKLQMDFTLREDGERVHSKTAAARPKQSDEPIVVFNSPVEIKDYEITDKGFLILAQNRSLMDHKQKLMFIDFDGELNDEEINTDKNIELLKDVSDNLYITNNSIVEQISLTGNEIVKGQQYFEEDFRKSFTVKGDLKAQKIYQPDWNSMANNSSSMIISGNASGMINPRITVGGTVYEFDFEKNMIKTGLNFSKNVKTKFACSKEDLIITNEEKTDVYIITNTAYKTKLMHVNLALGTVDKEISIPFHPHPDKIRIKKNCIYYLHADSMADSKNKKLYSYSIN